MTNDDHPRGIPPQEQADSPTDTGTLVIRTWHEPDQVISFRARLTYSHALDDAPNTVATADPDEALRIVRQWLRARSGS